MADKGQVKEAYETGEYTFRQLADKFNVSLGTIKSWAKRDKDQGQPWDKNNCNQGATKNKKKAATKKRATVDKKEKILALSAIGKSQREVGREVGVAASTVNKIVNENPDQLEQYRTEKKLEFIQKAWGTVINALNYGNEKVVLATVASESFDEKIEELIQALQNNGADARTVGETVKALSSAMNIPLKDVAIYIGTIYDKIALATGASTSNVNLNASVTPTGQAMKQMSLEELRQIAKLE